MITHVFWDIDDTMTATSQAVRTSRDAVTDALTARNLIADAGRWQAQWERVSEWYGSAYYAHHLRLLIGEIADGQAESLAVEMIDLYRRTYWTLPVAPGVENALAYLRDSGFRLGVISDGEGMVQRRKLAQTGLIAFFDDPDLIFISSEHEFDPPADAHEAAMAGRGKKPFPRMFERALQAAGCQPEQAAYVGDKVTDMVVANQIGMTSIRYLGYKRAEASLFRVQEPNFTLSDYANFPAFWERVTAKAR